MDEVTDYLNSNTQDGNRTGPGSDVVDTKSSPDSSVNKSTKSNASATNSRNTHQLPSQNNQQSNHQSHNHHINNNMVPIISVTPHSPGAKFNNILGKSFCRKKGVGRRYSFVLIQIRLFIRRGHTESIAAHTWKRGPNEKLIVEQPSPLLYGIWSHQSCGLYFLLTFRLPNHSCIDWNFFFDFFSPSE